MERLQGRVAVVTGGASGIGRAMGERFGREGMKVVLADVEAPALDATVDKLRANGIRFQDSPDTYYDMIDKRVPGHGHSIEEMRRRRILIDGSPETGEGLLLQIFTENMIGPIFFEVIQRKGNEGFGEGNFKALFESIELDQMRRGVL